MEVSWSSVGVDVKQRLVAEVMEVFGENSETKTPSFPGSMPVNICRRDIPRLVEEEYVVLEKTDGTRYMLYVQPETGFVYFINRNFDFYKIPSYSSKVAFGATLLDGELVQHRRKDSTGLESFVFLLYDAIVVNGIDVQEEVLTERIQTLDEQFINNSGFESCPLRILRKAFVPLDQLQELLQKVFEVKEASFGGVKEYIDLDRDLCHYTDGLVFTPVRLRYVPYTCRELLKWKYEDSADFHMTIDTRTLLPYIHVGIGRGLHRPYRVLHAPKEKQEEWASRATEINTKKFIIECVYDREGGEWKFLRERADKDRANHLNTLLSTLESTAQNISLDELQRLIANEKFSRKRPAIDFEDGHEREAKRQHL